jgi:FkbM family methyltransferase
MGHPKMKEFLHDCYQIMSSGNCLSRRSLLPDYIRMRIASSLGRRPLQLPALGFSLGVLSKRMGLQLYREIAIAQVYYFSFSGASPLIIDCGSNVGMAVLFFKKLFPMCHVIALEPDPQAFRVLERNVRDNRWENVTLHNSAVTGNEGTTPLYVSSENPGDLGTSTIAQSHLPCQLTVPSVRLSTLIGDHNVDFLKLDIEGAEMEVIDELDRSQAIHQVHQMVIEYHHHIAGTADCLSCMLTVLERNGFGYQLKCLDINFRNPGGFQVVWICAHNKAGRQRLDRGVLKSA